jgi:hypothetical protein
MAVIQELQLYAQQKSEAPNVQEGLLHISNEFLARRYSVIETKNTEDEAVALSAFKNLEEASKSGIFHLGDTPVLYTVLSLSTEKILQCLRSKSSWLFDQVEERINIHEPYVRRAESMLFKKLNFAYRKEGESVPGSEVIHRLCKVAMDNEYTRTALRMRDIFKYFGNPRSYPLDDLSSKFYTEEDPTYPMLVPLIHLHLDHSPEGDIVNFYNDYNKRHRQAQKMAPDGDFKLDEVFTPEELSIAFESRILVDFIDGWLYQTYGLPHTNFVIASSLTPYEAIRTREGYYHEAWMGMGVNDELMGTLRGGYFSKFSSPMT